MIRVGLVDDHDLFRLSLEHLINEFENCQVVMTAHDGEDCIQNISKYKVDVLLMDIQMPNKSGIETTKIISERNPNVQIIGLSGLESKGVIASILEAGACGYLLKTATPDMVEKAINSVAEGGMFFDPNIKSVIEKLLSSNDEKSVFSNPEKIDLSKIEIDLIRMVAQQKSNAEIASSLGKSIRTIENYRRALIQNTGSKNFIGVIIYAIKNGHILVNDFETDLF